MKKFILMSFLIIIGFVFQTSFMIFFNHFKVIPNFSLILLVIFAIMSDGIQGGLLGILTGLLYDSMIYSIFGLYTLIYFLIGALIGTYSIEMLRENKFLYSVAAGISTIFMHALLYLILFFLKFRVGLAAKIFPNIILETVINAVLVVFVAKIIMYLFDRFNVKV
ncbi:MAG TPA: rod shape-determining protein MreD [Sedimentibacter sp.]|nr:rod shape-determining protein MreD [Sedimentibacter sp.]HHZ00645.1 rod shape-determining protein MreD [Tissierellia bacterium]HOW23341.1 rod shape-determining protein MreD [Sedimentibacter sp.]